MSFTDRTSEFSLTDLKYICVPQQELPRACLIPAMCHLSCAKAHDKPRRGRTLSVMYRTAVTAYKVPYCPEISGIIRKSAGWLGNQRDRSDISGVVNTANNDIPAVYHFTLSLLHCFPYLYNPPCRMFFLSCNLRQSRYPLPHTRIVPIEYLLLLEILRSMRLRVFAMSFRSF